MLISREILVKRISRKFRNVIRRDREHGWNNEKKNKPGRTLGRLSLSFRMIIVEGRETYCTHERNVLLVLLLPGLSSTARSLVCSIAYLLGEENRYIFASTNRMQSELRFFPLKRQISASFDLSRKINKCHSLRVNVNISRSGVLVRLACKHHVDCRYPVGSSGFSIYLSFSSSLAQDFSVDRCLTCNYEVCLDWEEERMKFLSSGFVQVTGVLWSSRVRSFWQLCHTLRRWITRWTDVLDIDIPLTGLVKVKTQAFGKEIDGEEQTVFALSSAEW